jgi:hypothetical protein
VTVLKKPAFQKDVGKYFRIVSSGLYRTQGTHVAVPVGFLTDFASIPRPFRNLFSMTGENVEAAILHDYLYHKAGRLDDGFVYKRKWADKAFLKEMESLGVGWIQRKLMYRAVRVGGWTHGGWRNG